MAARLKVFATSDGLTEYVVAATSRPKALAAWGVRQDLFKEGVAREVEDAATVEAATAQPGTVLRRPAASKADLRAVTAAAKPKARKGPSLAALKRIADLEAKRDVIDEQERRLEADFAAERAKLQVRQDKAMASLAKDRAAIEGRLETARAALKS